MDEDSSTEQKPWRVYSFGKRISMIFFTCSVTREKVSRVGGTALDTQETISFAQHPGVSNCECKCPQYRFLLLLLLLLFSSCCFQVERLQDFDGGKTFHRVGVWGGNSMSLHGPMYERARFPYFLSLMRGRVMIEISVCRTQRAGQLID